MSPYKKIIRTACVIEVTRNDILKSTKNVIIFLQLFITS